MMENKSASNGVLKSDDIVYTLMKVSKLESPSSSSSNQSTSAANKPINCQTLNSRINNSCTTIQNTPNKFSVDSTFNIEVKLVKIIIKKLLELRWNDYIHWKTLLSFGLGLWIALCITDKYYEKGDSAQGNKYHLKIIEKTINKNFAEEISPKAIDNIDLKWYRKVLSYIPLNKLLNTSEVYIVLSFIIIIIFIEFRLRKGIIQNKSKKSCTQCTHNCFKSKTLNNNYYHDKFTIENYKSDGEKNIYDKLSSVISSQNRHTNPVEIIPYDGELHVNSDIFLKLKIIDSHDNHQLNDNTKRNHKHFSKLGIQSNVGANIDRISRNNDCNYNDDDKNNNEWKLNSQKFFAYDWNNSLYYCNNDNPIESINVDSTYDTEINKFIMSKCNKSTAAFEEITSDLMKHKNYNIGRRINSNDDKLSIRTIKNNKNQNNRIISSSPAFKKFLSSMRNNPTAFKTKLWISK